MSSEEPAVDPVEEQTEQVEQEAGDAEQVEDAGDAEQVEDADETAKVQEAAAEDVESEEQAASEAVEEPDAGETEPTEQTEAGDEEPEDAEDSAAAEAPAEEQTEDAEEATEPVEESEEPAEPTEDAEEATEPVELSEEPAEQTEEAGEPTEQTEDAPQEEQAEASADADTAAEAEQTEDTEQQQAASSPAGTPKPHSPTGSQTQDGSKPGSPKEGSKPGTPQEGSKPTSPKGGSKPGTPQEGSKPASPKEGSKPGTSQEGSKPGSPKEGSKPSSPKEGSKPTSPKEGSKPTSPKEGSKPPSPKAGSKPGTPQQGSKPATPQKGSKPPSPKASSKPGTPQEAKGESPKPGTPAKTSDPARVPTAPALPEAPTEEKTVISLEPGPDPLNLVWSFGVNERVPVLNITDDHRKMIMYVCGHTGILYDMQTNTQKLLQGHSNNITCTCVSRDKRWLATGDKGPDNTVIIWDTTTGFPVRTMFDPYPEGIVAIAITPDAKYLATLSAGDPQVVAIWDWTTGDDEPLHTAQLEGAYGLQNYLHFNPDDSNQLVSNSDGQVVFYSWTESSFEYFAPPLNDQDFNKPVGRYSHTIYLRNSTRALTATSLGNLVVWDSNKPLTVVGTEPTPDKRALKLVKLQDSALKVLTTTDDFIVIGDSLGHVRFLDQDLKLINWYQDLHVGPISAISFAHVPQFQPLATDGSEFPNDATIPSRKFVIKDFAVGSTSAVLAYVTADGSTCDVIHRDHDAPVFALDTHPTESKFAVGSYSGLLKIWDYELKEPVVSRYFEKGQMIRCCAFDPKGEYLAVGFMNGTLRLVDAITLQDELPEPYRYSRDAITHLAFSHDSKLLATADAEFTITLYRSCPSLPGGWEYMGRRRPHYKLIVDMLFTVHLDSNTPRLLTLGEDRMLVEYDLSRSDKDDIVVANTDRIEQSATSLCLTMYPGITKEQFILTANDQYKFKLYNSTTKMCRKTLLGPTYGSPLQKLVNLPTDNPHTDPRYMTYITVDKVGITRTPLTGNPHDAMALVAHPSGVTNLVTSHDGQFVFTAGGADSIVHMWNTNLNVLEAQAKLGGEDLIPFYGLLDGGRDGELFAELEDYFYYAQIRSQGVNTMDERQVSTKIPLSEVPFVMRAMGFYPSEQEVLDMVNEIKYGQYVETGKYVDQVDLATFIRLYVNHRPAFGLDPGELNWVFHALADSKSDENEDQMDRGYLLDVLQSRGEHMTEYELAEYLTTLLGYNAPGGSCELQAFQPDTAGDVISQTLPHDLTSRVFADRVLGFTLESDVLTLDSAA